MRNDDQLLPEGEPVRIIGNTSALHHKTTGDRHDHVCDNTTKCERAGAPTTLPGWWVPVNTHSTPVLTSVRRLWVARRSVTTDNKDATTDESNSLHWTMKSRMIAEAHRLQDPDPHFLKSYLSRDVNESAAYFEEHPELKFDGCKSKRAVVSAFTKQGNRSCATA